jgi:hypothetical protein
VALDVSGNVAFSRDASFNGNIFVNRTSYLSNITERVRQITAVNTTDPAVAPSATRPFTFILDYSGSSVFYIADSIRNTTYQFDVCMVLQVINFPSLTDNTRNYAVTVLSKGSTAAITNANVYAGLISYSTTSTPNAGFIPVRFSAPLTNIFTSSASAATTGTIRGNLITQTISYLYQAADSSFAFSNISIFNN